MQNSECKTTINYNTFPVLKKLIPVNSNIQELLVCMWVNDIAFFILKFLTKGHTTLPYL